MFYTRVILTVCEIFEAEWVCVYGVEGGDVSRKALMMRDCVKTIKSGYQIPDDTNDIHGRESAST